MAESGNRKWNRTAENGNGMREQKMKGENGKRKRNGEEMRKLKPQMENRNRKREQKVKIVTRK